MHLFFPFSALMVNGYYPWKNIEQRLSAMMMQPQQLFKQSPDFHFSRS